MESNTVLENLTTIIYSSREECRLLNSDLKSLNNILTDDRLFSMQNRCNELQVILEHNDLSTDNSVNNKERVNNVIVELNDLINKTKLIKLSWENFQKVNFDSNRKFIIDSIDSMLELCNTTTVNNSKINYIINSTIFYCKNLKNPQLEQQSVIKEILELQQRLNVALFENTILNNIQGV